MTKDELVNSKFGQWVNKRFSSDFDEICIAEDAEAIKSLSVIDTVEKRCSAYSSFKDGVWDAVKYLWKSAGGSEASEVDRQVTSIFPDSVAASESIQSGDEFKSVMLIIAIDTVARLIEGIDLWPHLISSGESND